MRAKQAVGLLVLTTATACGNSDLEGAGQETGLYEQGAIGVIEAQLSNNESCHNVTPSRVISGVPGTFGTFGDYDIAGCRFAYRIDNYGYSGVSGSTTHRFQYNDSPPTTQSECEKLRFGGYAWKRTYPPSPTGGIINYEYLGNRWRWGTWSNNACTLPYVEPVTDLSASTSADYRFALSARRYAQPKDTSSAFDTKPIKSLWQ